MTSGNRISAWLIVLLTIFTIINPTTTGDMVAFFLITTILLHKLFGEYLIFVFLALRPTLDMWRNFVIVPFNSLSINVNAAISLLLLAWSTYFLIKNRSYWKTIPLKTPWLLFILWCILSFIYSFDRTNTIIETIKIMNLFGLFSIIFILKQKYPTDSRKYIYLSLLLASLTPIAFGAYQALSGTGATIDGVRSRIFGTFAHPNLFGTFTLLLFMTLADYAAAFRLSLKKNSFLSFIPRAWHEHAHLPNWLHIEMKNFLKRWIPPALLFTSLLITLTYTRIAWIGLAVFILALCLLYFRKAFYAVIFGTILFYAFFYPLNTWLRHNYNYNLQSHSIIARLTSRNDEADSIKWRADIANKITPLFKDRPLIGYGYGSFSKVWEYNKGVENIWDNTSEAHNDYLKVGFEVGAIGLILFVSIFINAFLNELLAFFRGHHITVVFSLSILIYLLMSVSDNMLHHTPVIWWFAALWGYWSSGKEKILP
jgi:O-antigen ligase